MFIKTHLSGLNKPMGPQHERTIARAEIYENRSYLRASDFANFVVEPEF